MARRVRVGIQADVAALAAHHDVRRPLGLLGSHAVLDCIIGSRDQVAEDAMVVTRPRSQRAGTPARASRVSSCVTYA